MPKELQKRLKLHRDSVLMRREDNDPIQPDDLQAAHNAAANVRGLGDNANLRAWLQGG
jgi:hypothetical protein